MRDREDQTTSGPGFNRRDFLKGSGAAVAATAIATSAQEGAAHEAAKANVVSANAAEITLNVNGKDHKLNLEPRAILLDVLRNDLNLTGCKDVDDNTAAGADTVLIDGKPVLAGGRLAIQCHGGRRRHLRSSGRRTPTPRTPALRKAKAHPPQPTRRKPTARRRRAR